MVDCGSYACVSRERVLAICDWALARIDEVRREKDRAFLESKVRNRNWWRGLVRLRPLRPGEVHEALLRETDSFDLPKHNYPWRCYWESDFANLRTLALDATGDVRVRGDNWCELLRWCERNGWRRSGDQDQLPRG